MQTSLVYEQMKNYASSSQQDKEKGKKEIINTIIYRHIYIYFFFRTHLPIRLLSHIELHREGVGLVQLTQIPVALLCFIIVWQAAAVVEKVLAELGNNGHGAVQ